MREGKERDRAGQQENEEDTSLSTVTEWVGPLPIEGHSPLPGVLGLLERR